MPGPGPPDHRDRMKPKPPHDGGGGGPGALLVWIVEAAAAGVVGTYAVEYLSGARKAFPIRGSRPDEITGPAVIEAARLAINGRWPEAQLPATAEPQSTKVGASAWEATFVVGRYQYTASCEVDVTAERPKVTVGRVLIARP